MFCYCDMMNVETDGSKNHAFFIPPSSYLLQIFQLPPNPCFLIPHIFPCYTPSQFLSFSLFLILIFSLEVLQVPTAFYSSLNLSCFNSPCTHRSDFSSTNFHQVSPSITNAPSLNSPPLSLSSFSGFRTPFLSLSPFFIKYFLTPNHLPSFLVSFQLFPSFSFSSISLSLDSVLLSLILLVFSSRINFRIIHEHNFSRLLLLESLPFTANLYSFQSINDPK